MKPQAIDDGTPGEGIARIGEPVSQLGPVFAFPLAIACRKSCFQTGKAGEWAGGYLFDVVVHVPPLQIENLSRRVTHDRIDDRLFRAGLYGPIAPVDTGEDRLQPVIVPPRNGVELVIVTTCAVNGQARKRAHGAG